MSTSYRTFVGTSAYWDKVAQQLEGHHYLGTSLTTHELVTALQEQGFVVEVTCALSHHPRILTLAYARFVRRFFPNRADRHLDGVLHWFDSFGSTKLSFITGAFIAVKAKRIRSMSGTSRSPRSILP